MSQDDFRPREVSTIGPIPFIATFGRAELEVAAGWIVVAMATRDDTWDPVGAEELTEAAVAQRNSLTWMDNPFARPDFQGLVEGGHAEYVSEKPGRRIRFTESGRERLRCWLVRDA